MSPSGGVAEAETERPENQLGLELAEAETESRWVGRKRKIVEEHEKPEKKRKEKKRRFEKLTNWGELHPGGRISTSR